MSRLGKILRNLKEKEEERDLSRSPLFMNKERGKGRKILLTIAFFVLFTGSVLGGFFLVKIISSLKERKDLVKLPNQREIQIAKDQDSQSFQGDNIKGPSLNNNGTGVKDETIKDAQEKSKKISGQKEKVRKTSNDTKVSSFQKPFYKSIKELKQKEKIDLTPKALSEEKTPLLKEKKLIENLLLNAEEARVRSNIEEAINYYIAYLKHKEDPDVLNNLAGLYILKGEFKMAERLLKRALSIKEDEIFEINLLIILWNQGEKDRVCQYLKEKQFSPYLREPLEELKKHCN